MAIEAIRIKEPFPALSVGNGSLIGKPVHTGHIYITVNGNNNPEVTAKNVVGELSNLFNNNYFIN